MTTGVGLAPEIERKLARGKGRDVLAMTEDNSVKAAETFLTQLADARAFMLAARLHESGNEAGSHTDQDIIRVLGDILWFERKASPTI